MSRTLSCAVAALLAVSTDALAYPMNPWGGVLGANTFAYTQYAYVLPGPTEPIAPYLQYGLGSNADVLVGATATIAGHGGSSFGPIELFPRYFIDGKVGITPHLFWSPSAKTLTIAPEVHYYGKSGSFAFTGNGGWRPTVTYGEGGGTDVGTVFAVLAPEWFFSDRFAAFVELHDYYSASAKTNSNLIAPGVWFTLDKALKHSISVAPQLALPLGDPASQSISVGAWYGTTFGG